MGDKIFLPLTVGVVKLTIVGLRPARAITDNPWSAADSIRRALFSAQTLLLSKDRDGAAFFPEQRMTCSRMRHTLLTSTVGSAVRQKKKRQLWPTSSLRRSFTKAGGPPASACRKMTLAVASLAGLKPLTGCWGASLTSGPGM